MRRSWLSFAFLLLLGVLPAAAQISPGKLSRYHAELEGLSNCTKCHVLGQEVADNKCLECHSAIQARIQAGTGYHNSAEVRSSNCRQCHSEHNGREFEPVHWKGGRQSFDHALTGFPLEGAHRRPECSGCHKTAFIRDPQVKGGKNVNPSRTFLGLSRECRGCHEDEHGEQLTDNCTGCHNQIAWKPAPGFSHARTKYPLTGRHEQVSCEKCHPAEAAPAGAVEQIRDKANPETVVRFSGLDFRNCAPCHRDVHAGKFGGTCAECHTTAGFKQIVGTKFDHKLTDYPLEGRHLRVECAKCHTSGDMTRPLAHGACRDCHKDEHRGQFADRADQGACESCHTVAGFVPAKYGMDEHAQSRYPLTGSHLAVPCASCHRPAEGTNFARFDFPEPRCQGCHKDVHQGQLEIWITKSGCEFCHNTDTWHRTSFDHKLARFPLEGKHREILCLKCHKVQNEGTPQRLVWMKPLSMDCASCHEDRHRGQFLRADLGEPQTDCKRCHSAAGWKELVFDHNRDSRFPLDGAHARVACRSCHPPTTGSDGTQLILYRPLGTQCADCHTSQPGKL